MPEAQSQEAVVLELQLRAQAGDAAALHALALRHIQGAGVAQDDRTGYELLLKAADQGHAEAQYLVSLMTKDAGRGARYRRLAAEQGHARAQFDLALRYEEGRGVERDLVQALRWYGKSSAQGNMSAYFNFGKLWSFGGDGVDNADVQVDWFRARADAGDAVAQWVAGICYEFGRAGAPTDIDEAVRYYRLGTAQRFGPALSNLADKYERGLGVPPDLAQALHLYHQAALLNVPAAMYGLGCMYQEGRGVPQDQVQAAAWIRKAAEAGWPDARAALKAMPEGDFRKATELLAMAVRARDGVLPPAQLLLEFGNRVDDPYDRDAARLAFGLYLHAARQGQLQAQLQVASRYLRGHGATQDSGEAASWYLRAAESGDPDAQGALAALYESGIGVPKDDARARRWYEAAAGQGHRESLVKLGLRASAAPTLEELGITTAPVPAAKKLSWWKRR